MSVLRSDPVAGHCRRWAGPRLSGMSEKPARRTLRSAGCGYLSDRVTTAYTIKEARAKGLELCKVCH